METLLITGGAGFIGSCLVRQLVRGGAAQVVNLDLLTYAGTRESLAEVLHHPWHTFVEGDIGDAHLVRQLLAAHRPTGVVHLAAESHVDRSIDAPRKFVETNIVGTFTLLDECYRYWRSLDKGSKDRFRFVQVSSDEVFGSIPGQDKFSERSAYAPSSPYSATKAGADQLVRSYHKTYGLPTIITHSSNNYGPYQFPEKLIPLITLNALAGETLPVYGDGSQVRDWLHVADHTEALLVIIERGTVGESYCIGGDCERTNLEVVQAICKAVDDLASNKRPESATDRIRFVEDRPGHDQRYALDCKKIHQQLGWRPKRMFGKGIAETVQWYVDHPEWVEVATQRVDRHRRRGLL